MYQVRAAVCHRKTCLRHQSLPHGRIFLRRLIDLSTTVVPLHHHINFNAETRADISWWLRFLPSWPGVSLLLQSHWSSAPDMDLYTDASDAGYGAYWSGRRFNSHWTPQQAALSIAWREMYAILAACSTWGNSWARRRIPLHCDNAAVVAICSSKCPNLMSLVRNLYFMAATGNYRVGIAHIPGVDNCIVNHLSRFSMQEF